MNKTPLQTKIENELVGSTLKHNSGSVGKVIGACNNLDGGVFVEITYSAPKQHHSIGGIYIWNPYGIENISTFDAKANKIEDCRVI